MHAQVQEYGNVMYRIRWTVSRLPMHNNSPLAERKLSAFPTNMDFSGSRIARERNLNFGFDAATAAGTFGKPK